MGFPATDPEAVIVARIDAQTSLTTGTDLFSGPERPPDPASGMPHAAVFVRRVGDESSPDMGVSSDDRYYRLQVLVRGDPDGRAAAMTTGNDVASALNRWLPGSGGYVECRVVNGPIDLGVDDTEHPRFSLNLRLFFSG